MKRLFFLMIALALMGCTEDEEYSECERDMYCCEFGYSLPTYVEWELTVSCNSVSHLWNEDPDETCIGFGGTYDPERASLQGFCREPELICDDGIDNNFDGFADCSDADCMNLPICQP